MAIGTNSNIVAILADLFVTKGPAAAPIQPAAHPDPSRTRVTVYVLTAVVGNGTAFCLLLRRC